MTIYPIEAGNFKLDGGAMFGVVPKSIWQRTNPADENNLIDIAARCMLVQDGKRLILIDTGMGTKQSEKFFGYYYQWGDHGIDKSLAAYGFHRDDITDVFLTHLHFDHVGGAVQWNKDRTGYEPAFKNAAFWTNENHWKWATQPNRRERASFLKENLLPIQDSGQLQFIERTGEEFQFCAELGFEVFFCDGHTEKQMIPLIPYAGNIVAFTADLVPTAGHLPIPYVTGYDTRPLRSLDEKERFLNRAVKEGFYLWLEHDAHNPIISLQQTEKGVRLKETIHLDQFLTIR